MQPVKKLLLLAAFLFVSSSAKAAFVQGIASAGTLGLTQTCTFSGSVTIGDLLIVVTKTNGPNVNTVADTLSTSWTIDQAGNSATTGYYHGTALSSGSDTITITLASSQAAIADCLEYSGTATLDVFATSGTANVASQNITTTQAVTTIVGAVGDGTPLTISAPFTTRVTGTMLTTPNGLLVVGDVNETSTGTYTITPSASSKIAIASFAAATVISSRHRLIGN